MFSIKFSTFLSFILCPLHISFKEAKWFLTKLIIICSSSLSVLNGKVSCPSNTTQPFFTCQICSIPPMYYECTCHQLMLLACYIYNMFISNSDFFILTFCQISLLPITSNNSFRRTSRFSIPYSFILMKLWIQSQELSSFIFCLLAWSLLSKLHLLKHYTC